MHIISDMVYKLFHSKIFKLTPARFILLGFIFIILIGAILLYLPLSSSHGNSISFTDSLFTSVSSVCVTGLVVVDTKTQWSYFGEATILLLIQIGALGIMSVVTLFSMFTGKKLGLMNRLTITESLNNYTFKGAVNIFQSILIVTLVIEALGSLVLMIEFIPIYGVTDGIIKSIFHSVSSFCNAGFDIFGTEESPFTSLLNLNDRPLLLLTTSLLIIVGGLGFIVWNDIAVSRRFSKLTLHSKMVLTTSGLLLLVGTFAFFLFEYSNPFTLAPMGMQDKLLNAFFQSATSRTAGFSAIAPGEMTELSNFFTTLLMFIGGAPGSTAGGIKVTTFSILVLTVISLAKGKADVQIFERRIPEEMIKKAITVLFLAMFTVVIVTFLLLYSNSITFMQAFYESISAFANVGLSTGITPELSILSKYILMVTMLVGRIGPLTAIVAFTSKRKSTVATYRYPEGKITVG
ncbi:MAG: Trk family potassium uptake protein [Clostridia bacterium]|nr:Trk family potassium uptake protein [Clostridia bacterium]